MSSFEPWFQESFEQLKQQLANNTLAHALLLAAPKGAGKLVFSRALAEMILGEFKNNLHPDYFEISPEEDKKNISVDQIRALILSLSQTANQNGYKVAVIYPAESMNIAASNALLKTLEEPLGKTIIILCAHKQSRLLPTIISRCRRISIRIPSNSVKLFDEDFYQEGIERLNEILEKKINPVALAEKWAKEDVEEVLKLLQVYVIEIINLYHPSPGLWPTSPTRGEVKRENHLSPCGRGRMSNANSGEGEVQKAFSLLDKITEAKRTLQSQSNPNKQLLLENILLELSCN